jgi:branched-chain amino acid transport system ATP-binding protein
VNDVSVTVKPGEIVSVIGPNGAGKTTLFNMISGVYQPGSGKVMLNGEDVTDHVPAPPGPARHVPHLPELAGLPVDDRAGERGLRLSLAGKWPCAVGPVQPPRRARQAEAGARDLLRRVGLEWAAEREAGSLSHGSLKRLEIARAMALKPKALLLDEPAAGCNAVETEEIDHLFAEFAASVSRNPAVIAAYLGAENAAG